MLSRILVSSIFLMASMVWSVDKVFCQAFPSKPIRILAGTAGSTVDLTARLIAPEIASSMGQPLVVDNRPVLISAAAAAGAPPDGYLLLYVGSSFWIAPFMQKVSYDPIKDFAPITIAATGADILVVHPSLPVKSVKELIALAKARPGALNYSMATLGGPAQLAAELFNSLAGVRIVGIAYKGGEQTIIALLTGEVQMTFVGTQATSYLKSGRLKALAVAGPEPSARYPGLPTVSASGLPGYEYSNCFAIFAPARTPTAVISQLNRELVRAFMLPEVKEKAFNAGIEIIATTPDQLAARMKSDMTKLGKVIRDIGIKAE